MTEEERRIVEEAFKAAAGEYGYDARVEWEEESDLKVKWMRAGGSITFHLCDYLDDMPTEAAEALARYIFDMITGEISSDERYPAEVEEWFESGEFWSHHIRDYMSRNASSCKPDRELYDLFNDIEAHLGARVCPEVAWGRDIGERGSMASPLFNAVIVDERLRNAPPVLLRFVAAKGLAYLDQDDLFADPLTRKEHVDEVLRRVYTNAQIEDLTRRAAELVDDGYEDDEEYEEDEE